MQLIKDTKSWTYNADSLEEFIQVVRDRSRLAPADCWGNSSISGRRSFTETDCLADAADMLTNGWPEGAARILKGQADVAATGGLPDLTPSYDWDIGGEFPDVGAYCAGVPEHMGNPAPFNNSVSSVVRIAIPGSAPSSLPASEITTYGIALMSVIDSIQESGRSVALFWDMTAVMLEGEGSQKPLHTVVPLTTPGAPVDVSRLAFAFHPSMLRRCWFAAVEMVPDLEALGGAYGMATDRREPERREPGTIYPRGPWAMHDNGKLGNVAVAVRALSEEINAQLLGEPEGRAA